MRKFLVLHMRCFVYFIGIIFFITGFTFSSLQAQINKQIRCGTMQDLEYRMQHDPLYLKAIQEYKNRMLTQQGLGRLDNQRVAAACQPLSDSVTISVVVHVVGSTLMQTAVTDAVIQSQIDVLNADYQGQASNLSATPAHFQPIFGTSKFKFTLAKRNEFDEPFNGIRRRTTTATYTQSTYEDVKQTSTGGDDAIDPLHFLNIWVVEFSDNLLGISVFPGDPRPIKFHGFVCEYRAFGKNYPHLYNDYMGGRTTTHELGHYFNLYHNWGDDVSGGYGCPSTPACTNSDFRANPFISIPIGTDDTPNQCGATGTVAGSTAIITDACSPNPPGINYQNYMDYTIDRGLSMFSRQQFVRILGAFQSTDRGPLLCSEGFIAPPVRSLDAGIPAIITPDSLAPSCNTTISPIITLRNSGTSTLNFVNIVVVLDGVLLYTQPYSASLASYTSAQVTLNSFTTTLGVHQLQVFVRNPNNGTDQYNANDTASVRFTISTSVPSPIVEGFESGIFPPAGWSVINPNPGSITWQRTTLARNSGIASAFMNHYLYDTLNHFDYLVSPNMDVSASDSVILSFARAYKLYDAVNTGFMDTLLIQVSTDCGTTFPITAWKKGGSQLASVVGSTGDQNWVPIAPEWRTERLDLKPFIGNATRITISFTAKNRYGQNLFIDDINMSKYILPGVDAGISAVVDPFSRLCARSFKPNVVIRNFGRDTLKTVRINISVDGSVVASRLWTGSLPTGQTVTYVYDSTITFATSGNHTFRVFTSQPNSLSDINPSNDNVNVAIKVLDPVTLPLREGFESGTFPPANWDITSSNALYKWDTVSNRKNSNFSNMVFSEGRYAAWFWNRSYDGKGAKDDLYAPLIQVGTPDSVFLKFDIANVTAVYPGSTAVPLDTMEILLTKDCGKSFVTIYKKWGEELQTVRDPNFSRNEGGAQGFVPNAKYMWRTETIDISSQATANSTFQLVFRNSNNNGNNTFVDNVSINPVTLPAKLKKEGFLISPNPTTGTFYIQHYIRPVNLRGLQLFNSAGQIIITKSFNGEAISLIPVHLEGMAAGIYTVRLIYSDKVITQRIVKLNN